MVSLTTSECPELFLLVASLNLLRALSSNLLRCFCPEEKYRFEVGSPIDMPADIPIESPIDPPMPANCDGW